MMSSTQTRRSSASAAKRAAAAASENPGKMAVPTIQPPHQAKKRVALTNLTNNAAPRHTAPTPLGNLAPAKSVKVMVQAAATARFMAPTGLRGNSYTRSTGLRGNSVASSAVPSTSSNMASSKPILGCDRATSSLESVVAPCSMDISPSPSDAGSISLDETMSTCDSLKSSDIEYLDNADESAVASIERKTNSNLHISETTEESLEKITSASVLSSGIICKRDLLVDMETNNSILDIDNDHKDPQLCATIACDIYKHLRASENKKRPSTDFMEGVQKDINSSMRAILIDWLVEVAEEYRLVPDTLYLTVNYIDRYLSGNAMNRQHLQLLGVACMMIASKYEEICAPQVEEFCYITDNTYFKEEVLQMESAILNFLKFEMTAPTVKSFLRRFINAAHRSNEASRKSNEVPLLQLECLANYVAELSLPEYNMLSHLPSLIAASAVFLANFILQPGKRPWNATLSHYTLYKPSQLCECVKALHRLFCNSYSTSLPAIREKYSQHKYKFVAKKYCPSKIPPEYFQDPSS